VVWFGLGGRGRGAGMSGCGCWGYGDGGSCLLFLESRLHYLRGLQSSISSA